MFEFYIFDSVVGCYDMDSFFDCWLKYKIIIFEEIVGKGKNQFIFNQIVLEEVGCYVVEDVDVMFQLYLKMWLKLQQYEGLLNIFQYIEMLLVLVLFCVECNGVKIDFVVLYVYLQEIVQCLVELEQ